MSACQQGLLPWPSRDELTPDQKSLYDAIIGARATGGGQPFDMTDVEGRLHGPFNAMLVSPGIGAAMNAMGIAIRFHSDLGDRLTEIAILELARIRNSAFERYAHERVARRIGMSEAEIDALNAGAQCVTFSDDEEFVRTVVERLLAREPLTVSESDEVANRLGHKRTMQLIALVGYYDLLAMSLAFWHTPLPEEGD